METNYVIIRSDRAGVFFGKLVAKEPLGDKMVVELSDCRRLWRWTGCSLSQVAIDGVIDASGCKFTVTVPKITVMGVIEIIPCTEKAINKIKSVPEWKL